MPNASGAWLGLYGTSNSAVLWKSMLEAISFEYLTSVLSFRKHGIEIREVVGTGGGSRSRLWNQLKADMLDVRYATLKRSEGAVLADALLAARAVGDVKDLAVTVKEWVEVKERYAPVKTNTDAYMRIYEKRQKILHGPLREIFDILEELQGGKA
jgi:xylulokinase